MTALTETSIFNLGKYFYKLAERSQDVFWIRDMDYQTQLYISPAYESVWGCTCESLYDNGTSWLQYVHPDDRLKVEQDIHQIKNHPTEGKSYTLEYRILRADNELRRIQEVNFPLYDAAHQVIGFAGIAKDVTQEKLRLAELEQASNFFRFFAEKVHAVFWARDNSCNKQLYLSPGYEKVWGRSRASLYENPDSWLDTLHPEDRERASNVARFETLDVDGQNAQYEYRYRIHTQDGELRWIKDTSFPIQDEKNNFIGFAGIAEDITKEVLHEQKLRDAMERAEVANQAKSDFLAMISHELRTPLNAILGMAQILKNKGLPAESTEYVDIISNAGSSLLSLVSDILDFARLEAGKLSFTSEPFDLRALFSQVIQGLQYQAQEKNISLSVKFEGVTCSSAVLGDPNRVRQVLVNLVGNALKFTEKGYINVIVNCVNQSENIGLFEVAVVDTGIGIRKEKLDTLFEKFSQIDSIYHRKHRGIGLGLAITKQLVEAMGGGIQVKSEFGKGSEFRFTLALPIQPSQENTHQPMAISDRAFNGQANYPMNILLVEDNLINQKIAKLMLKDFGCTVDVVDNGQTVLERIDNLGQYDLIFMDVGLPDISGFEIVTQLRKHPHLTNMPIVAMTAHILERDRQQAFDAGMNRILAKPISYGELGAVLQEYSRPRNEVVV